MYERFAFQTLRTEQFDIDHYPAEAESVRVAARLAEEWRTRLSSLVGFGLPGRQPLVLYASHPHFTQTQVIDGLISEGTGGVTESLKRRMVLPAASGSARCRCGSSKAWAGVRLNAFGYAVVELALARPFDLVRQGWLFSVNLRPGY